MRYLILILALLCASCGSSLPTIKPYRMDIQQGNVVTSKMLLQLRPGMSKSQVRFIMGTPLIQDTFHANRWDYFYQLRKDGKIVDQRRVILDFENEALARVRGDVVAAGSGGAVTEPITNTDSYAKPAEEKDKKSLLDKLKFWKSDEKQVEKPQSAPTELVKPQAEQPAASKREAPAKAPVVMPEPTAAPQPEPAAPATETAKPAEKPVETPVEQPQQAAPAKAEEPAPAPEPEPSPQAAPEPAPQKAVEPPAAKKPAPAPKPQAVSKPAPKPAPEAKPEDDLPPEDAPGYFERMLEKIGF